MNDRSIRGRLAYRPALRILAAVAGGACSVPAVTLAQGGPPADPPEFPPFADVSKGFEKVVSTADGQSSLYTVWKREKDGQLLAELPRGFENQRHFIAGTLSAGDTWAGLHG